MKKFFRIRKRKYFLRVAESGLFFKSNSVVVQACRNEVKDFRVGFTASKKIGCAVVRNRAKRRMRAAADICKNEFANGVDYVFIARKFAHKTAWDVFLREILSAIMFLNKRLPHDGKVSATTD